MNHMKNQISDLSDSFPSLDDLLLVWCRRLMAKIFCLFHKIIISCITKCMTEPPVKIMMTRLEAVDQMYSLICDQ